MNIIECLDLDTCQGLVGDGVDHRTFHLHGRILVLPYDRRLLLDNNGLSSIIISGIILSHGR